MEGCITHVIIFESFFSCFYNLQSFFLEHLISAKVDLPVSREMHEFKNGRISI